MEQAVLMCLYKTLDSDLTIRQHAEAQLSAAAAQGGYGVALARIALQGTLPFGVRQLSAVVLKQYVKSHWERGSKHFKEPQTSDEDKAAIKAILPEGLPDDLPKIRTAIGMAISSIAKYDWPEKWPELLPILVNTLRTRPNANAVRGAVRCLSLIASDIEERVLPELLPILLPDLLSIVSSKEQFGRSVHSRALRVLYFCISSIANMEMDLAATTRRIILPLLPPWFELFASLLAQPVSTEDAVDWKVKMEVLKITVVSISCFGKHIAAHVPAVMAQCWNMFVNCFAVYEANVISEDGDLDSGDLDSDGENMDFEALIAQLFELLLTLAGNPRYSQLMGGSLNQLAYFSVAYMQMTREQAYTWARDPNQYVADEEDDTFSVRVSGEMFLEELIQQFEGPAISALEQAVQQRLQEAQAARAAGNPQWWRIREAALLAVGSMSETVLAMEEESGNVTFDFPGLVENVRQQDLSSGCDCPFLVGRALWVIARLAEVVPPEHIAELMQAGVSGLATSNPAPVQIGACRMVARLCSRLDKQNLQATAAQLYQSIGTLLQSSNEEVLHLVLETLLAVVKADSDTAAVWEQSVTEAVFRVWSENANDPLIAIDAFDVIAALAAIPSCQRSLVGRLTPPLSSLIASAASATDCNATGQSGAMVEGGLEMLALLLKGAPPDVGSHVHSLVMHPLLALMAASTDPGQLQSGTEVIRQLLRLGGEPMLSWNGANPESSLQAILEVIARLLKPESGESAALNVGPLITQMLQSVPNHIQAVLPAILEAIVNKLYHTSNSPVITGLLMVFCRLIHSATSHLMDFLCSRPSPSPEQAGQPALAFVMSVWIDRQNEIRGQLNIKLSGTAMAILLTSQHPSLQTIQVKGRRLDTEGTIRTRSRAKQQAEQWSTVPLAVKLVEMLSDLLIEAHEQANNGQADENDGDDDDDDDDNWDEGDFQGLQKGLGLDLFDIARNLAEDNDLFDDEEAKADPIYSIDLVAYVTERLQAVLGSAPALADASRQHLTTMQQAAIQQSIVGV